MFNSWYDRNPCGALNLKGSRLIWTTTLLSSLGFSLVGYGNAVLGGIINEESFKKTFDNPDPIAIGFVTAIYGVGAFVGAILTAIVGDRLGRRRCIAIGAIIMIIGCTCQVNASEIRFMSTGRFIGGAGLGVLTSIIPVLQAEISPQLKRGRLVAIYCTTLNLGILLASWINFNLYSLGSGLSWKLPLLFPIAILLPIIMLSVVVCESPRWLLAIDKDKDAHSVLASLYDSTPDDEIVLAQFDILKERVIIDRAESERSSFWKDFYNEDDIKSCRRLWTSIGVQIFQQLGGINLLVFFTSTLFEDSIKLEVRDAFRMSLYLQIWLVAMSIIPWTLIDRIGRRPLILLGISGQAVSMGLQALFVHKIDTSGGNGDSITVWSILAIMMLFLFEASFTIGMQSTVWVYCSEILPLRLRCRGTSLAASANYASNSVLLQVAPIILDRIGWGIFMIIAELNLVFLPIAYYFFKETKGLSLEEIDDIFITTI